MARVVLSEDADADQAEILAYLNEVAGGQTAGKYESKFIELYEMLETFPRIGAPRPTLGEGCRLLTAPPYVMIYEVVDGVVNILRIVHGRRNITSELIQSSRR